MRVRESAHALHTPALQLKAEALQQYISALTTAQLQKCMHVSSSLAAKTHEQYIAWKHAPKTPAMDSFVGDIYSGLRASDMSSKDREYADSHLRILSGLYGILRPYDAVAPYRLEMGYRLPDKPYSDLYAFWGDDIAAQLPSDEIIVNLAAVEYSKTFTTRLPAENIITPKFLTVDPKTNQPTFVVVHAKIARGAFARWMIQHRIEDATKLHSFDEIGYSYDKSTSTPHEPVFICKEFGGKGLSMRLA